MLIHYLPTVTKSDYPLHAQQMILQYCLLPYRSPSMLLVFMRSLCGKELLCTGELPY